MKQRKLKQDMLF